MTLTDLERRIIAVILSHFTEFGSILSNYVNVMNQTIVCERNVAKIHFPVVYDCDIRSQR